MLSVSSKGKEVEFNPRDQIITFCVRIEHKDRELSCRLHELEIIRIVPHRSLLDPFKILTVLTHTLLIPDSRLPTP